MFRLHTCCEQLSQRHLAAHWYGRAAVGFAACIGQGASSPVVGRCDRWQVGLPAMQSADRSCASAKAKSRAAGGANDSLRSKPQHRIWQTKRWLLINQG